MAGLVLAGLIAINLVLVGALVGSARQDPAARVGERGLLIGRPV